MTIQPPLKIKLIISNKPILNHFEKLIKRTWVCGRPGDYFGNIRGKAVSEWVSFACSARWKLYYNSTNRKRKNDRSCQNNQGSCLYYLVIEKTMDCGVLHYLWFIIYNVNKKQIRISTNTLWNYFSTTSKLTDFME